MFCIGIGKFNRYYWTIILSALFKILINGAFRIETQDYIDFINISFLNRPILNNHIFIRFIYYSLGLICFGIIFQKIKISKQKNEINYKKQINSEGSFSSENRTYSSGRTDSSENRTYSSGRTTLIHRNYLSEISKKSFWPILPSIIIYILNEMIIFYFDQKNYDGVNFWVLQIFFIHLLFYKKKKLKLYKHQILSFIIIIIFSFGIKIFFSFLKQCDYEIKDINNIDEIFKERIKTLPPRYLEIESIMKKLNESIRENIIKENEKGIRACKNMFNKLLLDEYFEYLIILSALGYLLGVFLHSYSAVKFKYFIDEKYVSPYLIIIFIGLIGFFGNIILLIISSFIPCGYKIWTENYYVSNFCHSTEIVDLKKGVEIYYFDNFLVYTVGLYDTFHPQNETAYNEKVRGPIDGILEIIFSFLLSVFGFFKTTCDLFIIKELGVFHLLFPEVIYQFIKDLIIIIYKISNSIIDEIQITQFIFIAISNFFALIGFCIYLELIEIRCCDFDKDLKENIILRSLMDKKETEEDLAIEGRDSDIDGNEENND